MKLQNKKLWIFITITLYIIFQGTSGLSRIDGTFSGENAYQQANFLTEKIGPRPSGSEAELKAGDYIAGLLRQYGWQVKLQNFSKAAVIDRGSLKKYSLINSRNIVAVLPGKSNQSVIIGAHYDSADFNVSGANDNASGVGVLLELARVLALEPRADTYVLVAFGAEEAGLVGSHYFVDNYDLSPVKLMVNLDMVGEGNRVALDGGGKVSTPPKLLQTAFQLARQQGLVPEVKRDFMLLARDSRDGGTSDFSPFLDKGVPAIGIGQGGKIPTYYHQPTDTIEHLNPNTMAKVGGLALSILSWGLEQAQMSGWNDLYLTLDLNFTLVTLDATLLKIFVIGSVLLALAVLTIKRRREWVSLVWLVPGLLVLTYAVILLSFAPEFLMGKLKGAAEPWFSYPVVYVLLHVLTVAGVLAFLSNLLRTLPRKALPREGDIYWAGSLILLGTGTLIMAANRWDFAAYLAFWLILTIFTRHRWGLLTAFVAPLPIYTFHWNLINSHVWTEFYRAFNGHSLIFGAVYALGIMPLLLAAAASLTERRGWRLQQVRRWLAVAWLVCATTAVFLPTYTVQNPQSINIRQEWQDKQLSVQASSSDILPAALSRLYGAEPGSKAFRASLSGAREPLPTEVQANVVKLNNERLITVDVALAAIKKPYLVKIKLRSEAPFTLVNGGDFFPLGKMINKVKLSGDPVGGIYGLILERTPPQPEHFQIYLKAKGPIRLTVETQYPEQFVAKKFELPKAVMKYENWCTVIKEI